MPSLDEIREQLDDTTAAIARLEMAMAQRPGEQSLIASLRSLGKRKGALETQFLESARKAGKDVCSYRLFSDTGMPTAAAFGRALTRFQTLVSAIYASVVEGAPRNTAKVSAEVKARTEFGFGYTYAGSIGLVMTLANEQDLFDTETPLDQAIKKALNIAEAQDTGDIAVLARELGVGPIRAAYQWADALVHAGLGVDIEWHRAKETRAARMVQLPELEKLRELISASGDIRRDSFTVLGVLEAFDNKQAKFKIETSEGDLLKGDVDQGLLDHEWTIKIAYSALVEITTEIRYSTEEEVTKYVLRELERQK